MKKILGIVTSVVLAGAAHAASYGDAGCGLGSLVFNDQSGFVQIFAATTNGISANQLFGITTGTLNCGGGGSSPTALNYIEANKAVLANDIARGQGETLAGLSEVMGCQSSKDLGAQLQKNYNNIFPSQAVEAQAVESSIKNVIKTSGMSCRS